MRMLQTDLERAGFRTAWLNAWHQQQEGRQLTALFNTIRTQAVPSWWGRQFVAAFRVRSRLIWGRGWFYKAVAVASAIGCALLLGDLLADGPQTAWAHVRANFTHHMLHQQQTAITGASLYKLDPFHKPAPATPGAPGAPASPATGSKDNAPADKAANPGPDPCSTTPPPPPLRRTHRKAEPIRLAVHCDLKRNFLWDHDEDDPHLRRRPARGGRPRTALHLRQQCRPDRHGQRARQDGVLAVWPSEEKAIRAAAETLPPPPMFRWLESFVLGGLAGFVALLFTRHLRVWPAVDGAVASPALPWR